MVERAKIACARDRHSRILPIHRSHFDLGALLVWICRRLTENCPIESGLVYLRIGEGIVVVSASRAGSRFTEPTSFVVRLTT
jgi:hypothetical protein